MIYMEFHTTRTNMRMRLNLTEHMYTVTARVHMIIYKGSCLDVLRYLYFSKVCKYSYLLRRIYTLVFFKILESLYTSMTESLDICIMCVLSSKNCLVSKFQCLPYQLQNIFKGRFALILVVIVNVR